EDAHDYRYFPEPDLPPLVVSAAWVTAVRRSLPELPWDRARRYRERLGLPAADSARLAAERPLGEYFDRVVESGAGAKSAANWVLGPLMSLMNESGQGVESIRISPHQLSELIGLVSGGAINQNTAKAVLAEMFASGRDAAHIVQSAGLGQVSDDALIARAVAEALAENPAEVASYRAGKAGVANWLFGQVMKKVGGRANPHMVREELARQLGA
ncbi:MAG: Asp-tRNA(Asn)/Glu-tRNA(Gln) amidotransferase GatCAB subunit B, partial [Anaerolineales bacterium]